MANLIQTVMSALTPGAMAKLADVLGEPSTSVSTGFGAAVPALLAGSLQRSASPAGARSLLEQVSQATVAGNPLDRLGELANDDGARNAYISQGQGMASSLLGGEAGSVASAVASHADIGVGSASKLLALAAPLVLGAIGRAAGPAPTPDGIKSLLSSQRTGILSALPAGLGSLFGLVAPAGAAFNRTAASADTYAANAVSSGGDTVRAAPGLGRFMPWIAVAAVLVALLFVMRNCNAERAPVGPAAIPPVVQAPVTPPVTAAPSIPTVALTLPGGEIINVRQGSTGFGLANFLASPAPAPRVFVFDNLNFDAASRAVTSESQPTVAAIAAILKAYPNANVQVVGYTDNQGDPAANKTLSEQRAATVKAELVRSGVAADHIEAGGMGEANPVADNATEAGRSANRRTELVVVKK